MSEVNFFSRPQAIRPIRRYKTNHSAKANQTLLLPDFMAMTPNNLSLIQGRFAAINAIMTKITIELFNMKVPLTENLARALFYRI